MGKMKIPVQKGAIKADMPTSKTETFPQKVSAAKKALAKKRAGQMPKKVIR